MMRISITLPFVMFGLATNAHASNWNMIVSEMMKVDASRGQQVKLSVEESPRLRDKIDHLAQIGVLKAIIIYAGAPPITSKTQLAAAANRDGTIYLNASYLDFLKTPVRIFHTLDYTKNNPDDLTFVMGFETTKVQGAKQFAADKKASDESTKASILSVKPGGSFDATRALLKSQSIQSKSDALAFLGGWEAMIDGVEHQPEPLDAKSMAELFLKFRYRPVLMQAMNGDQKTKLVVAVPTNAVKKLPDFNQMQIPTDEHNIAAVQEALVAHNIEFGRTGLRDFN